LQELDEEVDPVLHLVDDTDPQVIPEQFEDSHLFFPISARSLSETS
jgi:hypothetical protein